MYSGLVRRMAYYGDWLGLRFGPVVCRLVSPSSQVGLLLDKYMRSCKEDKEDITYDSYAGMRMQSSSYLWDPDRVCFSWPSSSHPSTGP